MNPQSQHYQALIDTDNSVLYSSKEQLTPTEPDCIMKTSVVSS